MPTGPHSKLQTTLCMDASVPPRTFQTKIKDPSSVTPFWPPPKNRGRIFRGGPLGDHLVTTWWPLGDHLVTTWWPLGDPLVTTWWPLDDHLLTTCWPLTDHLMTTCWPLVGSPNDLVGSPNNLVRSRPEWCGEVTKWSSRVPKRSSRVPKWFTTCWPLADQLVQKLQCKCEWLFYNAIGVVAQCPYKWGVGSAFHQMKIHIFLDFLQTHKLKCPKLSQIAALYYN